MQNLRIILKLLSCITVVMLQTFMCFDPCWSRAGVSRFIKARLSGMI